MLDGSEENREKRSNLIDTFRMGSKNTELRVNEGWVTNRNFNSQRS